ncbi:L,D-transpeptidase family protein [Streptomyces sp. NA04227]|uniref:L,D-transpeptidase family protein n=1 Tax=Streptomyces sp. NA04227 TaxID=2742136 RepID=UPI0015921290|nr:L,D-transpeptidase family protein [Streptomyces sp. NA04227]QKW05297.1 L,D-transpeptidase family protein [Streptomyces sp. NA04227]
MRTASAVRTLGLAGACVLLAAAGSGCGKSQDKGAGGGEARPTASRKADGPGSVSRDLPGVGERLRSRIPAGSRQVVAVYGKGHNSPDATVVLFTKQGEGWRRAASWPAHNGKKGWTEHHREGDRRSPVGVFTLTDAGGVLPDPGARLPYTSSASFQAPHYWAKTHWHDFDYVIAIDYNRVKGTAPNDPVRPEGRSKGGSIWLHMDHGSGTSACVSLSKSAMRHLLRTLDPAQRPVVVMGDRAALAH